MFQSPPTKTPTFIRSPKLDATGHYLKFPGYTTVSNVNAHLSQNTPWHAILEALSKHPVIQSHFALLPLESLHMTTQILFTEAEFEKSERNWSDIISASQPFFNEFSQSLEKKPIIPQIKFESIKVAGAISINFSCDLETTQLVNLLPRHPDCKYRPSPPHITLAYQYQPLDETTLRALQETLNTLCQQHLGETCFTLDRAKLCYHDDMTAFIPWKNPHAPKNLFDENRAAEAAEADQDKTNHTASTPDSKAFV